MLYKTKNTHGGDIYEGGKWLDFSANINPLGMPKSVRRAAKKALTHCTRYPDPYCRNIVQAISEHEKIPPDYILCGNGAAELIYAFCAAVKPKRAAELAPTFSEYAAALYGTGCEMERYALSQKADFVPDDGFLNFLSEKKPDTVFLCSPNNPTGKMIPVVLLEKILQACEKENIHVLLDLCFLDMTGKDFNVLEYFKQYPRLFMLKAFTKSYGMAGLRLGYGMSADKKLLFQMAKGMQPWNVSLPAQAAGVAALTKQTFLEKTVQYIQTERKRMERGLKETGFYVCPSEANYLLFQGEEGIDRALRKRGILIRNCADFQTLGSDWYRIAVRRRAENKKLLSALRTIKEKGEV